ncbi:MAG: TlpA disulfide reductase family protein [Verrucomicrobiota bacterium]
MKTGLIVMFVMLVGGLMWVEGRTWTQAETGRTLEGDFKGVEGDEVTIIRTNGTAVKVPLAGLSEADQTFIAEHAAAEEEAAAAVARPEVTHQEGEKLKVGDVIDMSFRSINAGEVDLASMKDKVVLLDFWATWCGPCIAEMPNVKKAYEKYHEKGFEIVGISLDSSKSSLEDYIEDNDMPWPQYYDGKGWDNELGREYGVSSIPAVYLVKNSEVIATGVRGPALEKKLEELLD